MTQEASTAKAETIKENSTQAVETKENIKTISQDELKSLLDENNKKINESLEKQRKDLEKLLQITKEAKVEDMKEQEEQKQQIDPFDAYRMEKQKERDRFLMDQMNPYKNIERRLAGKNILEDEENDLIQHHQETLILNELDNVINQIKANSKSVYSPFKEKLETLREDLRNFNYVKIYLDNLKDFEKFRKDYSIYISPKEIGASFEVNSIKQIDYYHDLLDKIYR